MLNKNLALLVLVIFAAGCGLETRTYVMTKDRVGLDQNTGNGGCFMGKCPPASTPKETTRKVYVLELTKPVPESEVKKIEETAVNAITETTDKPPVSNNTAAGSGSVASDVPPAPVAHGVAVPVIGELPGQGNTALSSETAAAPQETNGVLQGQTTYTVQKDDTLQKISKKIFGSYGKWYKIYEANKSKIKNPNVLKTGTVLDIPKIK